MKDLTIFTPTYNRAYILHKCYESLCHQSNKNFVWLIVDDGSTDDTEALINSFKNENKLKITYVKQENGGKHVAHNNGVLMCETEIFVCVDSDDYLTNDAVQIIYDNWDRVKNDTTLAGILALKGRTSNEIIGTSIPNHIERSSISDLYYKHKFIGDTTLVFKTSILKKYLFPVFKGENFIAEGVVYDPISQQYEMLLVNKIIYLCEYLDDGLSKNLLMVYKKNPNGYMYNLAQRVENARGIKNKYKAVSYYLAGCLLIKNSFYVKNCKYKFLMVCSIPKAILIYLKQCIKSLLVNYKIIKF